MASTAEQEGATAKAARSDAFSRKDKSVTARMGAERPTVEGDRGSRPGADDGRRQQVADGGSAGAPGTFLERSLSGEGPLSDADVDSQRLKPRSFSDSDVLARAGELLPYTSPVVKRKLLAARSDVEMRRSLIQRLNIGRRREPAPVQPRRRSISGHGPSGQAALLAAEAAAAEAAASAVAEEAAEAGKGNDATVAAAAAAAAAASAAAETAGAVDRSSAGGTHDLGSGGDDDSSGDGRPGLVRTSSMPLHLQRGSRLSGGSAMRGHYNPRAQQQLGLVKDSTAMRRSLIMRLQGPRGGPPRGPPGKDISDVAARRKERLERRRKQKEREAAEAAAAAAAAEATPGVDGKDVSGGAGGPEVLPPRPVRRARTEGNARRQPVDGESEGDTGVSSDDDGDDGDAKDLQVPQSGRAESAPASGQPSPTGRHKRRSKRRSAADRSAADMKKVEDLGGIDSDDERWVDSGTIKACQQCDTKFTVMNRKHHCRACGLVVCGECSPYREYLRALDAVVRVCRECHALLMGSVWDHRPDTEAFFDAVDRGDLLEIEARLDDGQDVNAIDRVSGFTPLHVAARAGQGDAARLLLREGAEVMWETPSGSTPLHVAALAGADGAVLPLLRAGADPEVKDLNGDSARDLAVKGGHKKVISKLQSADKQAAAPPALVFTQSPGRDSRKVVMPDRRVRELEPEMTVLEPAGKALQLNLHAVLDEELRWVAERAWQYEMAFGRDMQGSFEAAGLIQPADRGVSRDAEALMTGNAWSIGHLYGADIDLADAVNAVAQGVRLADWLASAEEEAEDSGSGEEGDYDDRSRR